MDKKKKTKMYDLDGTLINLYDVVEFKKEYEEEAFPEYGYYGILVLTLDDGELVKTLKFKIGGKESSLDDAYRNVDSKANEMKRLIEKLA
ncbi:hypothetical protein EI71_01984 [Anaeroplasma bactoclasticum]|jgi:hypothetical protein|uniref:Uncharacterized protein n=1 Tax=Anaeroplasma bactoclasticum TaxID=2088 RepID=A0A397QUH6_9MOLU|nr:hypothetical protein [Anaeroplasma bactoclasticum]RIA64718.1 hypothetical protein EI71_01984 [Anaeroplasma bactoclasticum]